MAVKKIQITADAGAGGDPNTPGWQEEGYVILSKALLAPLADAARRHFEEALAGALRRLKGVRAGPTDSVRLEVPGLTVRMTAAEMQAEAGG